MRDLRIGILLAFVLFCFGTFFDDEVSASVGLLGVFIFSAAIGIVKGIREE